MRRLMMVVGGSAAALVMGAIPAAAGPTSGNTQLQGAPNGGGEVVVRATLGGVYPIVAYDFALLNQCWFSGRFAGHYDSSESYPLLGPWFDAGGGKAYSEETVNLNDIPSGAVCRVSIVRGGPTVKGSTTSYSVN